MNQVSVAFSTACTRAVQHEGKGQRRHRPVVDSRAARPSPMPGRGAISTHRPYRVGCKNESQHAMPFAGKFAGAGSRSKAPGDSRAANLHPSRSSCGARTSARPRSSPRPTRAISTSSGSAKPWFCAVTSSGRREPSTHEARSCTNPWAGSTRLCRWPSLDQKAEALLAQGVLPGSDSRRPLASRRLARRTRGPALNSRSASHDWPDIVKRLGKTL